MEGQAMTKKIWISLLTLTFFLTLFSFQTTFAKTVSTNDELDLQTIDIQTEDDYSIQSKRLPERKDLGLGAGALVKMSSSQAKKFVQSNKTTEHEFKADFVGKNNVSKFDIFYNKKNNAVYLLNKNQSTSIPTGYHFIMP